MWPVVSKLASVASVVLARAAVVLLLALMFGMCMQLAARAETTLVTTAGVDAWKSPDAPARYLPGYASPTHKSLTPWVRAQLQHRTDTPIGPLALTVVGQTDPEHKDRISRLDADLRIGAGGVRAGILPYRISWCRADGGPWMAEPDAFCRFAGLKEISEGAFGAQAYRSDLVAGLLVDTMVGAYRPLVDGQNDKLGPYVAVGPTVKHEAHGASVNAVHLRTGIEARAGWLRTTQNQDSATGSYQRRLRYDSYYLAAQGHIAPRVDLRLSLSGYVGDQTNPALPFSWDGKSKTVELIYKPTSTQSAALGLSQYTNVTTYKAPPNGQRLQVDSLSAAWRKDWPHGISTTVQATRSLDSSTTRRLVVTERSGNAVGVRVSKTF